VSTYSSICVLILLHLCPHTTICVFSYSYIGGRVLWGFDEAALSFSPTYKFAVDSEEYSGGGKGRVPAWCDRSVYQALRP
jgi:hypothetical protein